MSDALQPSPPPPPTLRDRINAERISRARFIGHWIGYTIVLAIISGIVLFVAAKLGFTHSYTLVGRGGMKVVHYLPPIPAIVLHVVIALVYADLVLRRRHDRNRAGRDGALWLILGLLLSAAHLYNVFPQYLRAADALMALFSVYMLVVLVFLPGTRGPNRYGPDPRQH